MSRHPTLRSGMSRKDCALKHLESRQRPKFESEGVACIVGGRALVPSSGVGWLRVGSGGFGCWWGVARAVVRREVMRRMCV
jgi:hypothetical protein